MDILSRAESGCECPGRGREREGGRGWVGWVEGGLGGDVEGDIEVFYDHMIFLTSAQRDEDHM